MYAIRSYYALSGTELAIKGGELIAAGVAQPVIRCNAKNLT